MTEAKTSTVACPSCKTSYRIQSVNLGKYVVCPKCKTKFNTQPAENKTELPVIAKLAVAYKYLTPQQAAEAMKLHDSAKKSNKDTSFEKILIDLNFLTPEKIKLLESAKAFLAERVLDKRFGAMVAQKGFASLEDVNNALTKQTGDFNEKRIKRLIGDILIDAGAITVEQRNAVLIEQKRTVSEYTPLVEEEIPAETTEIDMNDEQGSHEKDETDERVNGEKSDSDVREENEGAFELEDAEDLGGEEVDEASEDEKEEEKEPELEEQIFGDKNISFTISGDRMGAYISILAEPPTVYTIQDIKDILKERGIRFGVVDDEEMEKFLKSDNLKEKFKIAEGRPPQNGANGSIKTFFDTDFLKAGTVDEDGNIDYKNRGDIPVAEPGELIAERIPKRTGKPGVDVFGNRIEPPYVIDFLLRTGRGVRISEDGKQVFAKIMGQPHLSRDGFISILPEYTVEHVNYKSGHVDFAGNVRVLGKVEDDFRLKASGDVIAGEILKADVDVGGDITVLGGIIGANIKCKGNITAKFIRAAVLEVYGNVTVEKEVMDARLTISGKALLMRGNIISSAVTANKGILAMNIGSFGTKPCTIKFGTDGPVEIRINELDGQISKIEEELLQYDDSTGDIDEQIAELDKKIEVFKKAGKEIQKKRKPFIKKTMDAGGGTQSASYKRAEIFLKGLNEQLKNNNDDIKKLNDEKAELAKKAEEALAPKTELEERLEKLMFERDQLIKLTKKGGKALPVVRASGQITEGSYISGDHKGTVLNRTLRSSALREVKKTEADGTVKWRLIVSNK